MKTLKAFHGKQAIKTKYLKRVSAHEKADEIEKGYYWKGGKGCAVGCTIEGLGHYRYETELGIPALVAHLEDALFEATPSEFAKTFPRRFLESVPVGADLSLVPEKLVVWQFEDKKYGLKHTKEVKEDKQLYTVFEEVVDLHKKVIAGETITDAIWEDLYLRADDGEAQTGIRAWVRARAWAGLWLGIQSGIWAGAWVRAWTKYDEDITATSEEFLKIVSECK